MTVRRILKCNKTENKLYPIQCSLIDVYEDKERKFMFNGVLQALNNITEICDEYFVNKILVDDIITLYTELVYIKEYTDKLKNTEVRCLACSGTYTPYYVAEQGKEILQHENF